MVTSKRTSIKGIQKYIEEHHKNGILRYRRFKNVLFNPLLNHGLELPTSSP